MHTITVIVDNENYKIEAEPNANLRQVLLAHDLTPYTRMTKQFNCGGRGLCATCGIWLETEIDPEHWHDKAADAFGYPRLSCQISIRQDMTIRLVTDKWVWGPRDPNRSKLFPSNAKE